MHSMTWHALLCKRSLPHQTSNIQDECLRQVRGAWGARRRGGRARMRAWRCSPGTPGAALGRAPRRCARRCSRRGSARTLPRGASSRCCWMRSACACSPPRCASRDLCGIFAGFFYRAPCNSCVHARYACLNVTLRKIYAVPVYVDWPSYAAACLRMRRGLLFSVRGTSPCSDMPMV